MSFKYGRNTLWNLLRIIFSLRIEILSRGESYCAAIYINFCQTLLITKYFEISPFFAWQTVMSHPKIQNNSNPTSEDEALRYLTQTNKAISLWYKNTNNDMNCFQLLKTMHYKRSITEGKQILQALKRPLWFHMNIC